MQLCRSFCELGSLRRLTALLPAVSSGSDALSLRSSLLIVLEPRDDLDVLENLMRWVRGVVFEVHARCRSCLNLFVD